MSQSIAQTDTIQHLDRSFMPFSSWSPSVEEWYLHVLSDRQFGNQIEGLEYEADLSSSHLAQFLVVERGDVVAVEEILAFGRSVQCAEKIHQGALADSRKTYCEHYRLALNLL